MADNGVAGLSAGPAGVRAGPQGGGARGSLGALPAVDSAIHERLQQGDAALLEGQPRLALGHFIECGALGFLPCLMVGSGGYAIAIGGARLL